MTDEDTGITYPPDGAVGEPFASFAEAGAACPYVICDPPFEVPSGGLVVSIVDQEYIGEPDPPWVPPPTDPFAENSYLLDNYTLGDDSITVGSDPVKFRDWDDAVKIFVGFSCTIEDACPYLMVMLSFVCQASNNGCPTEGPVIDSSNGWIIQYNGVFGVSWYKCFEPGVEFPFDVGTITYSIYIASFPAVVVGPFTARVIIDVA